MNRCRDCNWWRTETIHVESTRTWVEKHDHWSIMQPLDPDTFKPMKIAFEVRACTHPKLLFCERPLEDDGFAVADGSEYMANLYTAENFGCVRWEAQSQDRSSDEA